MKRVLLLAATLFSAGLAAAEEKVVIQYDCVPNYANWGGVTALYQKETGVRVPPDMKGSSASMVAIENEKSNPQADCVYYSGAIGFQAATKGLHQNYKPKGWEKIPDDLKDPNGLWWTIHTGNIAILVNVPALQGKPVPKSFADLLKPIYKGIVHYGYPTISGTAFTFAFGINALVGGGPDLNAGFAYLKKLDENVGSYSRVDGYNELVRGEFPIFISVDGNGLKAKFVDKAPVETIIAEEGTIVMPLVMGMVKGAPRPEETRKYLDWLLGDSAQKLMAESFFLPVMPVELPPDLAAKFPPKSAYAKARTLPLAEMAEKADAVKARWLSEIKGSR